MLIFDTGTQLFLVSRKASVYSEYRVQSAGCHHWGERRELQVPGIRFKGLELIHKGSSLMDYTFKNDLPPRPHNSVIWRCTF